MKRTGLASLFPAVFCIVLAVAVAAGCAPAPGDTVSEPDITGVIETAAITGVGGISGKDAGNIVVVGDPGQGAMPGAASVTLTAHTGVFHRTDKGFSKARFSDLRAGQKVAVSFSGPVAESYPLQAVGRMVVILESETLEAVKDRHTEELMNIPGVVGVGTGNADGRPCIMVFLADGSPELEARIPETLDGHPVVTEVTGQIRPL